MKKSIQLGLSKNSKQAVSFTIFAALCFSRKLKKNSLESSALKFPINKNRSLVELKASRKLLKWDIVVLRLRKGMTCCKKSHFTFLKFSSMKVSSISFGRLIPCKLYPGSATWVGSREQGVGGPMQSCQLFCIAKKKTKTIEKQRKKEKNFKAEALKRLSRKSKCYFLAILERREFKTFFCRPTGDKEYFWVFCGPSIFESISPVLISSLRFIFKTFI